MIIVTFLCTFAYAQDSFGVKRVKAPSKNSSIAYCRLCVLTASKNYLPHDKYQRYINSYKGTISLHCNENPIYVFLLGIARPQSQFPYSCVCERFIYSQDRSTYFPAAEQTDDHGNRSKTQECGNWTEAPQFLSGNICFELSVLCLCSVG